MGRPKGGKNKKYSYEFKLKAIKDYFEIRQRLFWKYIMNR